MDCTWRAASTLSFSVRRKSMPTPTSETMMPLVPRMSRNLRPLRSTSIMPTMVMVKLTTVKRT
jgi:hypothetical protein